MEFGIEFPLERKLPARELTLKGWCFQRGGHDLKGIRARIGDKVFKARRKQTRMAVGRMFPDEPLAQKSGFSIDLTLPKGTSSVILESRPPEGDWVVFETLTLEVPRFSWPWKKQQVSEPTYADWVARFDTLTDQKLEAFRAEVKSLEVKPLISVIVPVYNTPETLLKECLDSVIHQVYPHWELCIANDASPAAEVRHTLDQYAAKDERIKVMHREENGHISAASNSALALATGDFMALLDHDDVLPAHALLRMAQEINAFPDTDILFSDEDKIDPDGKRCDPYFKPDYNPDLLRSQNSVCHFGIYRMSLIHEIGGFSLGMEGSQDWDLVLRALEKSQKIRHLPEVLYHWRMVEGSTSGDRDEKPYALIAGQRAVQAHLDRVGNRDANVEITEDQLLRVRYPVNGSPKVSLVIPTRNFVHLLQPCVESILTKTAYQHFEILIVDNGSDCPDTLAFFEKTGREDRVKVLHQPGPFNYSALNNAAVEKASGSVIGLINNDIEVIDGSWLEEMLSHAIRPDIGAVGAKLLYPNGTIQHAGVFLGYQGAAGHVFKGLSGSYSGHSWRANLVQNMSAVTAACLLVEKKKYLKVEGLDEGTFAVAYNDVDFCLKLQDAGYRNLYTPFAQLYHHESASRGEAEKSAEEKTRANREIEALQAKWGATIAHDPAYNPNLSKEHEDGRLCFARR